MKLLLHILVLMVLTSVVVSDVHLVSLVDEILIENVSHEVEAENNIELDIEVGLVYPIKNSPEKCYGYGSFHSDILNVDFNQNNTPPPEYRT